MDIISKDLKADEAIALMEGLTTPEEIAEFIEGEDRKTVLGAAEERRKALTPSKAKQGEQRGPITKETGDFRDGVQKTKHYVTCDDVIAKMREAGKRI